MKHIIAKLILILMLGYGASACAQADPLGNLTVENGWITGTMAACIGKDAGQFETILVDCSLPTQTDSGEIYTVEYRRFGKRDVRRALREIGQSDQGSYISDGDGFRFTAAGISDPSAPISNEEAARQAVRIGQRFFAALGVEVAAESAVVSRPYDEEAYMRDTQERLTHAFSEIDAMLDRQRAQWKRRQKYETRGAQYTHVSFQTMTDGMRVSPWPAYPAGFSDEPDARIAFDTGVSVLVSDSGVLVEAQAGSIVQVKGRRMPQETDAAALAALKDQSLIRAQNWQEALCQAQQMGQLPGNSEEMPWKTEYMDESITRYASQAVVTAIYPCLHTLSKDEWVMIWRIESMQQFADGCRF